MPSRPSPSLRRTRPPAERLAHLELFLRPEARDPELADPRIDVRTRSRDRIAQRLDRIARRAAIDERLGERALGHLAADFVGGEA